MAQPTNAFDTYDQVGLREDLSNVISNISPESTPFQSLVGRGRAKATLTEWQTDSLASANASNAAVEGDDAALQVSTPTKRLGNYTQISTKTAVVTGTADIVDKAGRSREMAYQMAKRLKELKLDMEAILLSDQAANAGDGTTPRKTAGVQAFPYGDNRSKGASTGADPVYSSGVAGSGYPSTAPVAGDARAFTATLLNSMLQKVWEKGGTPTYVMVSGKQKVAVSGFSSIATATRDIPRGPADIIAAADVYVSDFGTVTIVPNRLMPEDSALVLDPSLVSVDYLRPVHQFELSKTGDNVKRQIVTEYALRVTNPQGIGVIADLS